MDHLEAELEAAPIDKVDVRNELHPFAVLWVLVVRWEEKANFGCIPPS